MHTRDQGALVRDPQVPDRVERIRKHNPSIAHADLEDRAILLAPFLRSKSMVVPELNEVAKDRPAWYLWKSFDLGYVGAIAQFDDGVDDSNEEERKDGRRKEGLSRSVVPGPAPS